MINNKPSLINYEIVKDLHGLMYIGQITVGFGSKQIKNQRRVEEIRFTAGSKFYCLSVPTGYCWGLMSQTQGY
jgi:hypothetical protein